MLFSLWFDVDLVKHVLFFLFTKKFLADDSSNFLDVFSEYRDTYKKKEEKR